MSDIGQFLADTRKQKRFSQRALAHELGISNTQVANYENGVTVPSDSRLRQIAEVLGVSAQPFIRSRNHASYGR